MLVLRSSAEAEPSAFFFTISFLVMSRKESSTAAPVLADVRMTGI